MHRWQAIVAIVAGCLILASALMHAVAGWPQFQSALQAASVAPDVVAGLATGWYLGSTSMTAFGLIVLLTGVRAVRSGEGSTISLAVIALALVGFGVSAFLAEGYEPHFLLFVFLGVMVALPAIPLGLPSASRLVARPPAGGS